MLANALDPALIVLGGGLGARAGVPGARRGACRPLLEYPSTPAASPSFSPRSGRDGGIVGAAHARCGRRDRVAAVLDETGLWRDLTELPETLAATLDARAGFSDVAAMLGGARRAPRRRERERRGVLRLPRALARVAGGPAGPGGLAVPSGLLARDGVRVAAR